MILTTTLIQPLPDATDKSLAGGKAVNLSTLIRAGFPVPEGFVITTDAYNAWAQSSTQDIPEDLKSQILRAYRALGSPPVAVRSSATAEDMGEASMAGQYETFLDVRDEQSLLTRVRLCWASLDSPRTRAYLKQHGIDLANVAMAVVVQKLVPADVAGVLFTANPQTGSKAEMLIEASWGLGEAVVSGLVQPDVLRIDRNTGRVFHARIADKQIMIPPGADHHEEVPVEADRRRVPCLKSPDVLELWKLGVKAADHFQGPQDIEWALHDGKLYLLQSRPITTLEDAETYETLLQSTRAQLRELLDQGKGPWAVHNLAETLPHPTPLTWSLMRRFMSGAGGFGQMYRQAGFEPSPAVCRDGFLTLVAGRIYMDASLCPEMFFENFPFKYDLDQLKRNPDAAQNPPTIPSGPMMARLKMARKAARAASTVHQLAADFDHRLRSLVLPDFTQWVRQEKQRDLTALTNDELIDLWHAREKRVMDDFAPQSLLPSLISGAALADLRAFLEECFWDEDPDALANLLSSAHDPDKTLQANAHLYELSQGEETLDAWLTEYGHRAPEEFDLASPRWRERREELQQLARRLRDGHNPLDLHTAHRHKVDQSLAELRAKIATADQAELDKRVNLARRYMPWREDGKFYLMLGYDLLRDVATEAARRLEIGEDVFLLTTEELFDAMKISFAPHHLLAQRKTQRRAEERIQLPHVIDPTNLDTLGTQSAIGNRQSAILEAFAISPGSATGPARIVKSPTDAPNLGDRYVLVCPSTDPSWTPLFTNAAALILERGGTLSHGAVVAREMSIPAVVLRDACTILSDGEEITVDGRNGAVLRLPPLPSGEGRGEGRRAETLPLAYKPAFESNTTDTAIPRDLLPPPPGRKDRRATTLRNLGFAIWSAYLLLLFLLPQSWLYQPSLAVLDFVLWPLVRALGKPGATAVIAALLAAATMVGQKLLTDNTRLQLAKKRAAALTKEASKLPPDSPRAIALRTAAAPVQARVVGASFVPLALLLGPMVLIFLWLPLRVDPASWAAAPGTPVRIVATIQTDHKDLQGSIRIDLPPGLALHPDSPATRNPPPIRKTLETYRATLKPSDLSAVPWELRELAEQARREKLAELDAYLASPIPAVPVEWTVLTPENQSDTWPIAITAGQDRLTLPITLGNRHAPPTSEITQPAGHPVTSLKAIYAPPPRKPTFFAPFGFLGRSSLAYWDIGWLGVYLLAYVPAMFLLRWALRIA
jgi:rifampicin phosphotransferase